MQQLKISVVTVCYNAAAAIEETILSVIGQSYDNIEYIIIDGGSTDGTVDIIKKYAEGGSEAGKHNHLVKKWISDPDRGIYDAMNKGITLATGDYINFMNAGDCFVDETIISKTMPYFNRDIDIILGTTIMQREKYIELKSPFPFYMQTRRIKHPGVCHQSTFTKRALLKKNKYDCKYKIAADFDFLVKAYKKNCSLIQVPIAIAKFDMRGVSSTNHVSRIKEFAEISGLNPDSLRVKLHIARFYLSDTIKKIINRR